MDEGGSLENCSPGNGTVGSNPTPSAKSKQKVHFNLQAIPDSKRSVPFIIGEVAERLKAVGC